MQPYEVIKAKSPQEAVEKSKFRPGQLAVVTQVEAVSNSDGTFSIFPVVKPYNAYDEESK